MSRLHHVVYSENKNIMGGLLKRNICSTVFLCNSRVVEKGHFASVGDSYCATVRTCHILSPYARTSPPQYHPVVPGNLPILEKEHSKL